MESWQFFLTSLRRYVVSQNNICIIFDRLKGLVSQLSLSMFCGDPSTASITLRWTSIGTSIMRIDANKSWTWVILNFIFKIFLNTFTNCVMKNNMSYQNIYAGYQLQQHCFKHRLTRLQANMNGETNRDLQSWFSSMQSWQWAQSFDDGSQYDHLTTNLVEVVNSVLKHIINWLMT